MVAGGREGGGGLGRERGRGMYLLQPFSPLINPYLSVFPTYQCHAQQVVVKTVINAGEFHVSVKKPHLTKTEMGSEVQGTFKWKWSIQPISFRPNAFHKNVL